MLFKNEEIAKLLRVVWIVFLFAIPMLCLTHRLASANVGNGKWSGGWFFVIVLSFIPVLLAALTRFDLNRLSCEKFKLRLFAAFLIALLANEFAAIFLPRYLYAVSGLLFFLILLHLEKVTVLKIGFLTFQACLILALTNVVFVNFLMKDKYPHEKGSFINFLQERTPYKLNYPPLQDQTRILGIGDSFGASGGAHNFHYLINEKLNQLNPGKYNLINYSIGELEPSDELDQVKRFGFLFEPQVVIFNFFVGNDFSLPKGKLKTYGGISNRVALTRIRDFAILGWFRRWLLVAADTKAKNEESLLNVKTGRFSAKAFMQLQLDRFKRISYSPGDFSYPKSWGKTLQIIEEIRSYYQSRGTLFLIVIHPDQSQVETQMRLELLKKGSLSPDHIIKNRPQNFLKNYCQTHSISCLDLLPVMEEKGSDGGLFLLRDTHYNENGNKEAGEAIYDFLLKALN